MNSYTALRGPNRDIPEGKFNYTKLRTCSRFQALNIREFHFEKKNKPGY